MFLMLEKMIQAKIEEQAARFPATGWDKGGAYDMLGVYEGGFLGPSERKRIEKIEHLDELEEWHLLMRHYSVSIGSAACLPLFERLNSELSPPKFEWM